MILSSSCKLLLVLLSLTVVLSVEATPRRHPSTSSTVYDWRIVGGQEYKGAPIPYIASMTVSGRHNCGGVILNARTILTAAHCPYNKDPTEIRWHVGDNTVTVIEGAVHKVERTHFHPKYYDNFDNDIAIIRLAEEMTFNERVKPVTLIGKKDKVDFKSNATAYGWGYTYEGGVTVEDLRFIDLPMVESAVCDKYMRYVHPITKGMICAGDLNGGIDSCNADSGGPLMQFNKLIGLVSWGQGCARVNKYGVYVNVQYYLPWIQQTLKKEYGEKL